MITKAGSPGGGQCSAPRLAEVCDSPKRGELGRAIFGSRDLRSHYPLAEKWRMMKGCTAGQASYTCYLSGATSY